MALNLMQLLQTWGDYVTAHLKRPLHSEPVITSYRRHERNHHGFRAELQVHGNPVLTGDLHFTVLPEIWKGFLKARSGRDQIQQIKWQNNRR